MGATDEEDKNRTTWKSKESPEVVEVATKARDIEPENYGRWQ